MNILRFEIANTIFKYAVFLHDDNNHFRKKWADVMFKLAEKISPDK